MSENKTYKIITATQVKSDDIIRHNHQRFIITECFEPCGMGLSGHKKLIGFNGCFLNKKSNVADTFYVAEDCPIIKERKESPAVDKPCGD